MTYAIVVLLATIFTFLGFAIECTQGNITHVKHGREPNAGAAVFPNFPTIPLLALGFAWTLDQWRPNCGFWAIVVLFFLYLPVWWLSLRQLTSELDRLKSDAQETQQSD